VEVWGGGQRLGRAGEQAEEQAHHGDPNGDGGGCCVLGHAQGRDPTGFIGQERRKQLRPSVVPIGTTTWAPRRLATRGGAPASGGWRCARACVRCGRVSPA
jgi:hypothetical protein